MYGRMGEIGTQDLSFLVGSYLNQVCLGPFDLGLNFDGSSIGIMISSSFGIQLKDHQLIRHDVTLGHLLRPFLNRDVTAAAWAEGGTLVLTFDGGDQIHIFDDSEQYESYTISHGSTTIII